MWSWDGLLAHVSRAFDGDCYGDHISGVHRQGRRRGLLPLHQVRAPCVDNKFRLCTASIRGDLQSGRVSLFVAVETFCPYMEGGVGGQLSDRNFS